jgi:hypothetical protein
MSEKRDIIERLQAAIDHPQDEFPPNNWGEKVGQLFAIAAGPVPHVVPVVDYDAVIAKILNDAAKTLQENLYRNAFGVMARITYTDDGGLDYEVLHPDDVYLDCKPLDAA